MKLSHNRKSHFSGQCKNFIVKKRVERAMKSSHNFPLRLYFQFVQDKICLTGVFCMPVSFCGRGKAERFVKAAGGRVAFQCVKVNRFFPGFAAHLNYGSHCPGGNSFFLKFRGDAQNVNHGNFIVSRIHLPRHIVIFLFLTRHDSDRRRNFSVQLRKKTYFQGLCSRVSSRPTDEARKSSAHKAPCF